jgi:putative acyl-CoA dehydrogenase
MCLDVLRALGRSPDAGDVLRAELATARGSDTRLDYFIGELGARLAAHPGEADARRLTEMIALALQATLLVRFAPSAVADGFIASRIAGDHGGAFGTLPSGIDLHAIVDRAAPTQGAPAATASH